MTFLRHSTLALALIFVCTAAFGTETKELVAGSIYAELSRHRLAAGAPLTRRADLDAVALGRAEALAALEHKQRKSYSASVVEQVRAAGIRWFGEASTHTDMSRGFTDPGAAFVRNWRRYRQAWDTAMAPRFSAFGLAVVQADDGWVIFAGVFLDEQEPPDDPVKLERRCIEAVNRIRGENGLGSLVHREALSDVARSHSSDMAQKDYFAHEAPDGSKVTDRVLDRGLVFAHVAENLWTSQGYEDPVSKAVESWMTSPGHRKAILTADFIETGMGVSITDDGTFYFTQIFFTPQSSRP